ncbi:MAG: dihydroorotate dehydrogenase electron transfer subunit [Candidatus Omnitrophica bacterium]|nr:dihydroorotate dehydrogenase electron transfer subunit [Candidatus Omnitrophota bacterium]
MKDIKATILSNVKVKGDYYKIILDAVYIAKHAKPGQFVQVRCASGTEILFRRPFSIHRARSGKIEMLYEVVGKGTEVLSCKRSGECVDVLGPLGNGFTLLPPSTLHPSPILIAGGIGTAPLVFLAEELAKRKIKPIVLIGARTKSLILCEKDFKKAGADVKIATDDASRGYKGFVSGLLEEVIKKGKYSQGAKVYCCGPDPMMKSIASICLKHGLKCEVSLEETMACGIGACLGCVVKLKNGEQKLACKDGPVFDAEKLSLEQ